MPSPNLFYAFRIEGEFSEVKTRSVPKQETYRPLVEVTSEQPVFNFSNVTGTLVGFFTPRFYPLLERAWNAPAFFVGRPAARRTFVGVQHQEGASGNTIPLCAGAILAA